MPDTDFDYPTGAASLFTVAACTWTQNEDGWWETACGKAFVLDGTPTENNFRYCAYCGYPLVEAKP